jgi:hypothetical protein
MRKPPRPRGKLKGTSSVSKTATTAEPGFTITERCTGGRMLVFAIVAWIGGLAAGAWSLWAIIVAFAGGDVPLLPIHFSGFDLIRGLAWLFIAAPIAMSVIALVFSVAMAPFVAGTNRALRHRRRDAAPDHARLLLADFWTEPTHTQPVHAALMAGEFAVHLRDCDVYSVDEAHAWLAETGWRLESHLPLAGPQSVIVAGAG